MRDVTERCRYVRLINYHDTGRPLGSWAEGVALDAPRPIHDPVGGFIEPMTIVQFNWRKNIHVRFRLCMDGKQGRINVAGYQGCGQWPCGMTSRFVCNRWFENPFEDNTYGATSNSVILSGIMPQTAADKEMDKGKGRSLS